MTREDKYLLGCLFAIHRLQENGSTEFATKVDGKWETISWEEICKWIEKQYAIESEDKCKNCEYYRNPDYTRCHECKAESEVEE